MREEYPKLYSKFLDREMESAVFTADPSLSGTSQHSCGQTLPAGDSLPRICFVFPPQSGRFYDFKNFGMVEAVRPFIESGQIMLVCVDGIDGETWSFKEGDPRARIELQEKWFHFVTDELYPVYINSDQGRSASAPSSALKDPADRKTYAEPTRKALVTGCSMGGVHAGNFFFRRPDLFDGMVSLSGLFNAQYFFGDYMDDLIYANSPVHFLPDMPEGHPWLALYRKSRIITCCGQGAWEDDLLAGTRDLDRILTEKDIPHWSDYWGFDVNHDWDWWQKQLPYFLGHLSMTGYL